MFLLSVCNLVLWCGSVLADVPVRAIDIFALVELSVKGNPGGGTGFVVKSDEKKFYVITAEHVIRSAIDPRDIAVKGLLYFPNASPVRSIELGSGIVALELPRTVTDQPSLAIDPDPPLELGQDLWVTGFPQLDGERKFVFYATKVAKNQESSGQITVDAATHPGLSGAPYLTSYHTVVGVHISGDQTADGVGHFVPVTEFLGVLRDRTGIRPASVSTWSRRIVGGLPAVYTPACPCLQVVDVADPGSMLPISKFENRCKVPIEVSYFSPSYYMKLTMDPRQYGIVRSPPPWVTESGQRTPGIFAITGCPE